MICPATTPHEKYRKQMAAHTAQALAILQQAMHKPVDPADTIVNAAGPGSLADDLVRLDEEVRDVEI